jgi:hypothetical protein
MALFPLGILSAAGAGGAAFSSDYELIETQILGSAQAEVVFSSLATYASTYKHLQIRSASLVNASTNSAYLRFNGDTASNYVAHYLEGNGSSVGSSWSTTTNKLFYGYWAVGSTTAAHGAVVDILDAYSSSKNKTVRSLNGINTASPLITLYSGLWMNTNSTTSLTVGSPSNFLAGSRFSLYGIRG